MSEEQHKAPPAGLRGTTDHVDAGDGWLIVRLLTRQAMDREGAHMDHCLGDGSYDELAGDEELTGNAIWSLRDPDGVSWATLDVHWHTVVMAKGPGNRTVRKSAARRLSALVAAFRATGRDLGFAGETKLLVTSEGRVMREDQAPAAIREEVRARHRLLMRANGQRQARPHEVEVTTPEAPGVRWVMTMDTQAAYLSEEVTRIEDPAVQIVATVSLTPPDTVDIRQDEAPRQSIMAPAGSWIGRIYSNRMARMPPLGPLHASLMKEELWKRWDGDAIPSPTAGELD